MYIKKNFPLISVFQFGGFHVIWLTLWGAIAVSLYAYFKFEWLAIPWVPVALIGTAVAFYIGFKNNSAYDRLWEARKIWGGIVNESRSFGTMIRHFVSNQFRESDLSDSQIHALHQRILYRHIAWLYTLRTQLLVPTSWEHINDNKSRHAAAYRERKTLTPFNFPDLKTELQGLISPEEAMGREKFANFATQLIDVQSSELASFRKDNLIDDFRHMELQKILTTFYTHQGKAERIKKFPLPRQYGSVGFYFVALFMILLPFGMLSEFSALGGCLVWLTVPFTTMVGWVFIMMELVGDYSENPFERLGNDIPMYALSRTIEIDLREMLGETDIPPKIEPLNGVLM